MKQSIPFIGIVPSVKAEIDETKFRLFVVRSMRSRYVLTLLVAGILTGCDTFESHEYRITQASRGDAARVQRILRDIATDTGIPEARLRPSTRRRSHFIGTRRFSFARAFRRVTSVLCSCDMIGPLPKRLYEQTVYSGLHCQRHSVAGSESSHQRMLRESSRYIERPNQSLEPTGGRREAHF
jgi:hypothetical protein